MEMLPTRINGEFDIVLPKHRAERPEWYTDHGWEKARLKSMSEHINTDDIVYYVGAELGEMPCLCALWGARVVLFEPNDKAWPVIKATFDANGVAPIKCFDGFASDTDRMVFPDSDELWPRKVDGEITTEHGFNQLYQEAEFMNQTKIDTYAQKTGLIPKVIALDVEGSEGMVLRGAEQTMRVHHPKIYLSLHPEFLITQYKEWSYELRAWIKGLGYKETLLSYDHEAHFLYEQG